jgi:hypothetical protein
MGLGSGVMGVDCINWGIWRRGIGEDYLPVWRRMVWGGVDFLHMQRRRVEMEAGCDDLGELWTVYRVVYKKNGSLAGAYPVLV